MAAQTEENSAVAPSASEAPEAEDAKTPSAAAVGDSPAPGVAPDGATEQPTAPAAATNAPAKAAPPKDLPISRLLTAGQPLPRQAWLWQAAEEGVSILTRDPAAMPSGHASALKALQMRICGPRFARIIPVKILKTKNNSALISEGGEETRPVPLGLTIPWYEGLLLLEELENMDMGEDGITWHKEFANILKKERAKYNNGMISAAAYVKRSLLDVAVTAPKFRSDDGKYWDHRRGPMVDNSPALDEGKDADGYWRVREVTQYLPPWVAFCHDRCGIYQDSYLLRWAPPYSEVDYGATETGWDEAPGATWEPDECLPTHLDSLRIAAKKRWIATQTKKENAAIDDFRKKRASQVAAVLDPDEQTPQDDLDEMRPLKRPRTGEDNLVCSQLFETVLGALDVERIAKNAERMDFQWNLGRGTLGQQIGRLIDATLRDKRVAVAWTVARTLVRAANLGALSPITRIATETMCDLAKSKKIDLRVMEDIISDLAKHCGKAQGRTAIDEASGAVAWVLVHMFPQKRDAGWGWGHMAWRWSQWWDLVARVLKSFKPADAFTTLRTCLELMVQQAPPNTLIRDMPGWVEDPIRVFHLEL